MLLFLPQPKPGGKCVLGTGFTLKILKILSDAGVRVKAGICAGRGQGGVAEILVVVSTLRRMNGIKFTASKQRF